MMKIEIAAGPVPGYLPGRIDRQKVQAAPLKHALTDPCLHGIEDLALAVNMNVANAIGKAYAFQLPNTISHNKTV